LAVSRQTDACKWCRYNYCEYYVGRVGPKDGLCRMVVHDQLVHHLLRWGSREKIKTIATERGGNGLGLGLRKVYTAYVSLQPQAPNRFKWVTNTTLANNCKQCGVSWWTKCWHAPRLMNRPNCIWYGCARPVQAKTCIAVQRVFKVRSSWYRHRRQECDEYHKDGRRNPTRRRSTRIQPDCRCVHVVGRMQAASPSAGVGRGAENNGPCVAALPV
jgi:hypothetical protein